MRVAVGTDEELPLLEAITGKLEAMGHEVIRVGSGCAWPEVGHLVGEQVAGAGAERGIVCCWTGTGVSIAANKVPGVRAALCVDAGTANGARRWNDANVLALSLRLTTPAMAEEIVEAFMTTAADPEEAASVDRVERSGRPH